MPISNIQKETKLLNMEEISKNSFTYYYKSSHAGINPVFVATDFQFR